MYCDVYVHEFVNWTHIIIVNNNYLFVLIFPLFVSSKCDLYYCSINLFLFIVSLKRDRHSIGEN